MAVCVRVLRLPLALLLFALAIGAWAGPASAQAYIDPPPNVLVDENGVNLADGNIHYQLFHTLPAVDPAWQPFTRHWMGSGWRDTMTMTLTINLAGTLYTVAIGTSSEAFTTSNGTTFASQKNIGSTLAWDFATARYLYTDSSGTVYHFDPAGFGGTYAYARVLARATQIVFPSGARIALTYRTMVLCTSNCIYTTGARLQNVSSSNGFSFQFEYAADGGSSFQTWLRLTKVTRYNRALEYCDPAANGCSFANPWPSIQYGQSNVSNQWTETETNAAGETAQLVRLTRNALISTRRPGSAADNMTVTWNSDDVGQVVRDGRTWVYNFVQACCGGWTMTATVTRPGGGQIQTVAYEMSGLPISFRDELGRTTTYTFNQMNLTDIAYPTGNALHYTYDSRGNQTSRTFVSSTPGTPANVVTAASFDPVCSNRLTCNRPNSRTDPNGNTTDYTYDPAHGGVLTETLPAPAPGAVRPQTRTQYAQFQAFFKDSGGSIVASGVPTWLPTGASRCQTLASCAGTADEARTVIDYGPQSAGTANNLLPVASTAAAGDNSLTATTATSYDANGRQLTVDGPLAGPQDTTRNRYDIVGRTIGVAGPDPDGAGPFAHLAVRTTYNADGQPTLVEHGNVADQSDAAWAAFSSLHQDAIGYDAAGRKATEARASGGGAVALTQFSYDAAGRAECVAVRMNAAAFGALPASACTLGTAGSFGPDRIVKRLYDIAGRLTQVRSAVGTAEESASETRTYADNDMVATIADGEGNLTSYGYDGLNRLTATWFPVTAQGAGASSATDYEQLVNDPAGNIVSRRLRDGNSIGFTYDGLNRVIAKDVPGTSADVAYAYDNLGRMTSATFGPAGPGIFNARDALGRTTSTTSTMGGVSRTLSYQYDLAGNRTRITHPDGNYFATLRDTLGRPFWLDSSPGAGCYYSAYGADGLPGSRSRCNGASTWVSRDGIGRLNGLGHYYGAGGANDVLWLYDLNAASQIRSVNRDNDAYAWTGHYAVDRTYTANGLNQYMAAGAATFGYDANGNLTSDGTRTYAYDAENRLVSSSNGAALAYDPLGRLYQVTLGAATTRFLYDGDALVAEYDGAGAMTRRYVHWDGADVPIIGYDGPTLAAPFYLHADHQGSIVAISGASGASQINRYDEYGIPGAGNGGRFQYTGQAWLPELGMYYYKARVYSPTLGRFMQTDPTGYDDGMNLYAYVGNDPLNQTDPDGQEAACVTLNRPCLRPGADPFGDMYRFFFGDIERAVRNPTPWNIVVAGVGVLPWGRAARVGRLVIGKMDDLARATLRRGEFALDWASRESVRANWLANSSFLREVMRANRPIRDVSVNPRTGELINNTGFLRAERNLLQSRGWTYNPNTRLWSPPRPLTDPH